MADQARERIEPYLMVVLSRRFDAISRQMTNTLLRSARSIVVNTARDFSPVNRWVALTSRRKLLPWQPCWRRTRRLI